MSRLAFILALLPATAWANGQTTHVWITLEAIQHLDEGPVLDLLARTEMRDPLVNGAMFPDGGYAVGDDYGELAHWEPFQQAYLGWIRDTYDPPYDEGEAAGHVAFLMGMGSHGMADEVFDSLFVERSRVHDPGWQDPEATELDTASDVLFAHAVGGVPMAESWLPAEVLAPLFGQTAGHAVSIATLEQGHQLLFGALGVVDALAWNKERIATFTSSYPWSEQHLLDASVPGSPPHEAMVVASYWEDLWRRLHEEPSVEPVLDFVPGNGSWSHPQSAADVEARLGLAFARGVVADSLDAVRIVDEAGELVPVEVGHYYGDLSHAVVVEPTVDWDPEAAYTVVVGAGLMDFDGVTYDGEWTATFSTGEEPPPVEPPEDDGCSCASTAARGDGAWVLLLLPWVRRRR